MMTPGSRKLPQRAEAPGTTRTPASAKPCFKGSLSAYSNGPTSRVSMAETRKSSRIACFSHSWTTTSPSEPTSATRASPWSSRLIASWMSAVASGSPGCNSARRSHNALMVACRSAITSLAVLVVASIWLLGHCSSDSASGSAQRVLRGSLAVKVADAAGPSPRAGFGLRHRGGRRRARVAPWAGPWRCARTRRRPTRRSRPARPVPHPRRPADR